jgi:hypothetical protein
MLLHVDNLSQNHLFFPKSNCLGTFLGHQLTVTVLISQLWIYPIGPSLYQHHTIVITKPCSFQLLAILGPLYSHTSFSVCQFLQQKGS